MNKKCVELILKICKEKDKIKKKKYQWSEIPNKLVKHIVKIIY